MLKPKIKIFVILLFISFVSCADLGYNNPSLPKIEIETKAETTTTTINVSGNISDTNWDLNTTVLQNESGILGIVDSFFQNLITNLVESVGLSLGFNNTRNATYELYAYNMSDGVGSGNESWNESYANTLYSDIIWGYNQTSTYSADEYYINLNESNTFEFNDTKMNETISYRTVNTTYTSGAGMKHESSGSHIYYNDGGTLVHIKR